MSHLGEMLTMDVRAIVAFGNLILLVGAYQSRSASINSVDSGGGGGPTFTRENGMLLMVDRERPPITTTTTTTTEPYGIARERTIGNDYNNRERSDVYHQRQDRLRAAGGDFYYHNNNVRTNHDHRNGGHFDASGAVPAAIHTQHSVEFNDVPTNHLDEIKPTMVEVGASSIPLYILFRSTSSTLNVRQQHEGEPATVQETSSEDEAHVLKHSVTKPIIQEIAEVIVPYRKIVQQIQPVQENVQTIIARNSDHGTFDHNNNNNKVVDYETLSSVRNKQIHQVISAAQQQQQQQLRAYKTNVHNTGAPNQLNQDIKRFLARLASSHGVGRARSLEVLHHSNGNHHQAPTTTSSTEASPAATSTSAKLEYIKTKE